MPAILQPRSDELLDEYLPIAVSTLVPDQCLAMELHIRDSGGHVTRLYRSAELPFEAADVQRLAENGCRTLFIRNGDAAKYQEYLRDNLPSVIADETRPVSERFSSLNAVVSDVLAALFQTGDIDTALSASSQMADHCVELLTRDDYSVPEMLGVMRHDYHTFTH